MKGRIGFVVGWDLPPRVPVAHQMQLAESGALAPARLWPSNIAATAATSLIRSEFPANCYPKRVQHGAGIWRYAAVRHTVSGTMPALATEEVIGYVTIDTPALQALVETLHNCYTIPLPAIAPTAIAVAMASFMRANYCPPLRRAGGTYFVPTHKSSLVDRLRTVAEQLSGTVTVFYVAGEPVEQASLLVPVQQMFEELVQELRSAVERVKRATTLEAIAERAGQLIDEGEVYADLLSLYSRDLRHSLETARREIFTALQERQREFGTMEVQLSCGS